MLILFFYLQIAYAAPDWHSTYLQWTKKLPKQQSPEKAYRFSSTIHRDIASLISKKPGVISPFRLGYTVKNKPIWGFRIKDPKTEVKTKVLVFAGLHALEWVGTEVAFTTIETLVRQPVAYVEVIVIPIINEDRRQVSEQDLLAGNLRYRRVNSNGVDLDRDYAVHRQAHSFWRHIFPHYYTTSPAPLSQPESRALDKLLQQETFEAAISLHCFGGYIFYPWAGIYQKPQDHAEFVHLSNVMMSAQRGMHPYRPQQLSRFAFFFKAHGSEIDHLYGKYGIKAFLIEMTRSGIHPFRKKTWKNYFRWYNPVNPQKDILKGHDSILALTRHLGQQHW